MSRFAADPKWLIYLPPTMSPSETTAEPGLLEHPAEAFAYYRNQGVPTVVCEEKHMGSRAVVIVCRDEEAARARFGVAGRGHRHLRHPHRAALLRRRGAGAAVPGRRPRGDDGERPVGRTGDGLGLPGLRTDALVGQGAGAAAAAVRRRRRGGDGALCPRPSRRCDRRPAHTRGHRRRCWTSTRRGRRWRGSSWTPTAATAGRCTRWPT